MNYIRTIKFRAWDNSEKQMYYSENDLSLFFSSFEKLEFPVMQFTGLLDNNGKEIYEGDIVNEFRVSRSLPEGRDIHREIKWENDMTLDDSYGETVSGFCMFGGALEVIGNIYEK